MNAMNLIEDKELLKLAEEVKTEETVKVSLNELRARVQKKPRLKSSISYLNALSESVSTPKLHQVIHE